MRRSRWLRAVYCLVVALLSLGGQQAAAQDAKVDRLLIVEAGFYTARKTGEDQAPGTTMGHVNQLADVKFLEDPPDVTAKLGTSFGVRFRVVGDKRDATAKLRSVWKIPGSGIRNPKNNNVYRESISNFDVTIGNTTTRGYSFDETWEIARGVWMLEIWQGDRRLLERSFMIE